MPLERIGNPITRFFAIGQFFTNLTQDMLGGQVPNGFHNGEGDIEHFGLDAKLEVKGSSSTNPPKIYQYQLDQYLGGTGFPLAHCWYLIFVYSNNRFCRISKVTPTISSLYRELARRTQALYILDARVVAAIATLNGVVLDRRFNQEQPMVRITYEFLRALEADPDDMVRKLRLKPKAFAIRQAPLETVFRHRVMRFRFLAIVPRLSQKKLNQLLAPRLGASVA